ncbi:uncharacterized protein LOC121404202 [Drosophila obscura]|uniref:uncharacterized protein LOC121404202 n=1 Tax=Drosophila obscura TaxID=7282 RepID=UPI001BB1E48C|nr:uncharacterized protein LOC121404202 [Drosophila obscura]
MLKFEEIQAARILCLQTAQECFKEDRILLLENKPLRSRSQLLKLSPIVCKNGLLRERRGRNPRKTKGYICLFVCLVTSAIHLELAAHLSTDTFLACLRRFMSLRGKCSQIFSDNGTNFVGAKRALDEMQQLLSSQEHQHTVAQSLANDGIKWSFIPPHSPHWGGEVGVIRAFRQTAPSSRYTDLTYLSPAHFLIGRPFTTIPEGDLSHLPINRLDYWQHLQAMYQGFWKRWHQEYLTSLQQRHKWNNKQRNISVDNVVLVKDSNLPPAAWILARVLEAHPGPDGLVRAVKLKTSTGEMTRPISKLAVLPNSETMFQGGPGC